MGGTVGQSVQNVTKLGTVCVTCGSWRSWAVAQVWSSHSPTFGQELELVGALVSHYEWLRQPPSAPTLSAREPFRRNRSDGRRTHYQFIPHQS